VKILLGDFNSELGTEDVLKRPIANNRSHEVNNDNNIRVVNFEISKYLIFPHIATFINTFRYLLMEKQPYCQVLIDKKRHSSVLGVRYFTGND
jgi:hypothetical protein